MLRDFDEYWDEMLQLKLENAKMSGLTQVRNLLHMSPWFKDNYDYIEDIPQLTIQKLLKGNIRSLNALQNDIYEENANLEKLFSTGQIDFEELSNKRYFLVIKKQFDEVRNDDIFLIETLIAQ